MIVFTCHYCLSIMFVMDHTLCLYNNYNYVYFTHKLPVPIIYKSYIHIMFGLYNIITDYCGNGS